MIAEEVRAVDEDIRRWFRLQSLTISYIRATRLFTRASNAFKDQDFATAIFVGR